MKLLDKVDSSDHAVGPRKKFAALTTFDYDIIHYRFELMMSRFDLSTMSGSTSGNTGRIQTSIHETRELHTQGIGLRPINGKVNTLVHGETKYQYEKHTAVRID